MALKAKFIDGAVRGSGGGALLSTIFETGLRFLQLIFGVAIIGLYAQDIDKGRKAGAAADPRWIYATVVSTVASLSALIYMVLSVVMGRALSSIRGLHLPTFIYDCILCILWLTLFGIFAKMYVPKNSAGNNNIERMKHALWVDLINLGFWILTATWCGLRWWRGNKAAACEKTAGSDEEYMRQI